ncbi:hypothetical protein KKF59_02610 [Patescibacteria group bacterium]|nr:hypothetical protein [Patescibacteria group bacterium]MBU1908001.1 hypothetical protein [Patescibacteria group bacterium]
MAGTNTVLIFDRDHTLVGELITTNGRLEQILFTERGESLFGEKAQSWVVHGIPMLCQAKCASRAGDSKALYHTRVKTRQPEFGHAFETWMKWHGLACLPLDDSAFLCWNRSLKLPLEPNERFAVCVGLACAGDDLSAWNETLEKAEKIVDDAASLKPRVKKKTMKKASVKKKSASRKKPSRKKSSI